MVRALLITSFIRRFLMSLRNASLALLAGLTLAAPSAAFATPERPVIAQLERASVPAPAPQQDAASYAEREAQNQQVAEYEGGQAVIYISGGALVVLLLLLLLI
jgi:hypothetical protein